MVDENKLNSSFAMLSSKLHQRISVEEQRTIYSIHSTSDTVFSYLFRMIYYKHLVLYFTYSVRKIEFFIISSCTNDA